jgi:hypothetical protein
MCTWHTILERIVLSANPLCWINFALGLSSAVYVEQLKHERHPFTHTHSTTKTDTYTLTHHHHLTISTPTTTTSDIAITSCIIIKLIVSNDDLRLITATFIRILYIYIRNVLHLPVLVPNNLPYHVLSCILNRFECGYGTVGINVLVCQFMNEYDCPRWVMINVLAWLLLWMFTEFECGYSFV